MRESLEFHDSTISSIDVSGTSLRIRLDAYVHRWDMTGGRWKGTGWIHPVELVLTDAVGDTSIELPVDLAGGEIRAGQVQHSSLVSLPFRSSEAVWLRLELVTGRLLEFNCGSFAIERTGEGRFVENLPHP